MDVAEGGTVVVRGGVAGKVLAFAGAAFACHVALVAASCLWTAMMLALCFGVEASSSDSEF